MASQQGLRIGAEPRSGRLKVGDGLSATDDGEMLAPMLDRVEDVGEVPGSVGRTYFRHKIRLSDHGPVREVRRTGIGGHPAVTWSRR